MQAHAAAASAAAEHDEQRPFRSLDDADEESFHVSNPSFLRKDVNIERTYGLNSKKKDKSREIDQASR